jgi:holo-[acyl-carrier protein] synthase
MNISTGIDIVEIEEIEKLIAKHGSTFLNKVFTPFEIAYCEGKTNRYQHYAARFAAKEATMKALGQSWLQGVQWKHIEARNDDTGRPQLILIKTSLKIFQEAGFKKSALSISHSARYSVSSVILV